MRVLLDTNFIISCIRKKIDFISELEVLGFTVILPREVLQELKDLKTDSKMSREDRVAIELALVMFSSNKIKKATLGGNARRRGSVDEALIKKGKENFYIATLDKEVQRNVNNIVIINSAKNNIDIERK